MNLKKLTGKEEELMKILWHVGEGFVKDLVTCYPKPRPHYNTVSSLVRTLEDKGFINHHTYGNTHLYYPCIAKKDYRKSYIKDVVKDYFDNSYKQTVSMFIDEHELSHQDLDELIALIESKKHQR